MRFEMEMAVTIPALPNFILINTDRVNENYVAVESLNDTQLTEIGKAWTRALVLHAAERRGRK